MAASEEGAPIKVEPNLQTEEKDNDRRVHVGNLSWTTDEERLKVRFSEFGVVEDVKIIRERGRSKGYGFVTFETADQAKDAISSLNKVEVDGRTISVDFARPKDHQPEPKANVHVAKLPESVDDEKLRTYFQRIGDVEDARVVGRNGVSSGYGFVRFKTVDDATRAIEELNGQDFGGHIIDVAYARRSGERPSRRTTRDTNNDYDNGGGDDSYAPRSRGGGGPRRQQRTQRKPTSRRRSSSRSQSPVDNQRSRRQPQHFDDSPDDDDNDYGRKLYVGGLSENTDEEALRLNFSAYGELDKCEIVRDSRTNRSRSYAFVTFQTEDQAQDAINGLNAIELDDQELTVEIARSKGKRAGGRRPFRRGRGGRGGSGRGRGGGGARRGRPRRSENNNRDQDQEQHPRDSDRDQDRHYQDNNGWEPELYGDE